MAGPFSGTVVALWPGVRRWELKNESKFLKLFEAMREDQGWAAQAKRKPHLCASFMSAMVVLPGKRLQERSSSTGM